MIGFILIVFGFSSLIAGVHIKRKNARCTAQAKGTLTDIRKIYKRGSSTSSYRYYYSYSVDGQDYDMWADQGSSSSEASEVGDACTIWYNPTKPKEAQAYHQENNKATNAFIAIGIILILVGLFLEFWWVLFLF